MLHWNNLDSDRSLFFLPPLSNIPGFQWLTDEKRKDDMRQCGISGLIFQVMILLEGRGNGEKRHSLSSLMLADFLSNVMWCCCFPLSLSLSPTIPSLLLIVHLSWGRNVVEDGILYNSTKQNPLGFSLMLSAAAFEGASQAKPQQSEVWKWHSVALIMC